MRKSSMILLRGRETATVLRHLEEIVGAGNTVVFSFQNPQRIMALVTRLEQNTARSNPEKSNPRITMARGNRMLN